MAAVLMQKSSVQVMLAQDELMLHSGMLTTKVHPSSPAAATSHFSCWRNSPCERLNLTTSETAAAPISTSMLRKQMPWTALTTFAATPVVPYGLLISIEFIVPGANADETTAPAKATAP